jgi:hypothetical protein
VLAAAQLAHPSVHDELLAAYTAHGLLGCGREVEIASGQTVRGALLNPGPFGLGLGTSTSPFLMQFKVLVPPNAASLAFTLRSTVDQGGTTQNVRYYVNYGGHVVYKSSGMTATQVKTSSFSIPNPAPAPTTSCGRHQLRLEQPV